MQINRIDLPDDIIHQIVVRLVRSRKDLVACSLVSRKWSRHAFSVLYRSIRLRNSEAIQRFVDTLSSDDEHAADQKTSLLVRRLHLCGAASIAQSPTVGTSIARSILPTLSHLTQLSLHNFDIPHSLLLRAFDGLSSLRELHLCHGKLSDDVFVEISENCPV